MFSFWSWSFLIPRDTLRFDTFHLYKCSITRRLMTNLRDFLQKKHQKWWIVFLVLFYQSSSMIIIFSFGTIGKTLVHSLAMSLHSSLPTLDWLVNSFILTLFKVQLSKTLIGGLFCWFKLIKFLGYSYLDNMTENCWTKFS